MTPLEQYGGEIPPLTMCETHKGKFWEYNIGSILEGYGHKVERMTHKHEFDLLIDDTVRVDVKSANIRKNGAFDFDIRKDNPTCDFYILVTIYNNHNHPAFIIPAEKLSVKHLTIYPSTTWHTPYCEEYKLIRKYIEG